MKKEKKKKKGPGIGYRIYQLVFFALFFIVPFTLANFVEGGHAVVEGALPFVVAGCIVLFINALRFGKHYTVFENEEANRYVKKEDINITYTYDEYTHTT